MIKSHKDYCTRGSVITLLLYVHCNCNHDVRFNHGSTRGYRGGRNDGGNRGNRRGNYRHLNAGSSRYGIRFSRNEDAEGDVSMSGDSSRRPVRGRGSRGRFNNRGRGSRRPSTSGARMYKPAEKWFKVTVPFGSDIGQKNLYSMISSYLDGSFDPVQYSTDGKRAYFFVKGADAAESIRSISRRITKPDGHKLIFHVAEAHVAQEQQSLTDSVIEKLKVRMSDRYDPATQLLNLSNLYQDEVLSKEGIRLPLSRFSTMSAITKIVVEHIPELSGLDVSNNRLSNLGHFADLVKGTPNVASLNLGQNQIRASEELDKLKGWTNITELVLDGNDVCSNYASQDTYAR
ncbi:nuclear RNA export factor 1 [Elysia marginata]|uniref:Nuclear RNA export factor 1 n=1 Tax=Elysia marginata TaxID=1093978 RepID=A0AAV4H7S4_9GAST|nr:nuclear RNA export factor 1 [Elysia marginata]